MGGVAECRDAIGPLRGPRGLKLAQSCGKLTFHLPLGDHPMSATSAPCDSARINLRISHEAKALIERAAAIMGATVSSFMLHNAYEAARRIVADKDTLVLSQEAFEAFIAKCEKPSKPTKTLRKFMALR